MGEEERNLYVQILLRMLTFLVLKFFVYMFIRWLYKWSRA